MLKKIAIALVAASMLTAPAFAKNETAGTPAASAVAKSAAKPVAKSAAKPVAKSATTRQRTAYVRHKHVKRVRHVHRVRHAKTVKHVNKQISKHATATRTHASAKTHLRTMKHKASAQAVGTKSGQRSAN